MAISEPFKEHSNAKIIRKIGKTDDDTIRVPLKIKATCTSFVYRKKRIVEITTVLFLASTLIYGVQIVINVVNVHE